MSPRCCKRPPHRHLRGQSTTEFVVLALVLVPLFTALPVLGKYLDLAHSTEQAARYVVFEHTVVRADGSAKSDALLADEVRRRFFSTPAAPIKSGDVAGDFAAHRNPLWHDHRGNSLLPAFADAVTVASTRHHSNAPAGAALAGGNGLRLPPQGEIEGRVSVRLRDLPAFAPFDRLGLRITRHQVVLANAWTAASSADTAARIAGAGTAAYPIAPLRLIGTTVGTLLPPLLLDRPIEVGTILPEIVPCDRLGGPC